MQLTGNHLSKEIRGLEPTRAAHTVISFQNIINPSTIFKAEFYSQNIFKIPLDNSNQSTYSTINYAEGPEWMFLDVDQPSTDPVLVNSGIASNYGLDLSLQRFISDNYYLLIAASIYNSKYEDIDNVRHNTRFNGNYIFNLTAGKEFIKEKVHKTRIFGMNLRAVLAGGMRETAFEGVRPNLNDPNPFNRQLQDYFRSDIRLYWKWNKRNITSTLAIDVQNVTNHKNDAYYYHDVVHDQVILKEQLGLIPVLSYKIEF